jgi:hypothetical protein
MGMLDANKTTALVTLISNQTMRAAADIIHARGIDADIDALVIALRVETKAAVGRILDDGRALLDGGHAGWLDALVRTECNAAALAAVNAIERDLDATELVELAKADYQEYLRGN